MNMLALSDADPGECQTRVYWFWYPPKKKKKKKLRSILIK